VDQLSLLILRDEDIQPVLTLQSANVKILLHGEARAQQANGVEALRTDPLRCRIDDVQEGDADTVLNDIRRDVHGIGAQHDQSCPAALQALGSRGHLEPGLFPAVLALQHFDLSEIHRIYQALGGVQPAQSLAHRFIKNPVIFDRRFPTHTGDQSNGLH